MTYATHGTTRLTLHALALVVLLGSGVQADPGWTQFRGPNATGIVEAPTLPTRITTDDYLWQIDLPGLGHSSPVFWQGRLVVTSEVKGQRKRQVQCVDAKDGSAVWTHEETYREAKGITG